MNQNKNSKKSRKSPHRPASLVGELVLERKVTGDPASGASPSRAEASRAEASRAEASKAEASKAEVYQRYQDMLRSAVDWCWETNSSHELTVVSSPVAASLDFPAQLLIGRSLLQLVGATESETALGFSELLEERRPFRDVAVGLRIDNGPIAQYWLSGVPVFDLTSGEFRGFRGTGRRDISEKLGRSTDDGSLVDLLESVLSRKDQLEWQLAQARSAGSSAQLARIAHELRTPLNAIIGFSEVIRDRLMGDDLDRYAEYGGNIHESGHYLLELVNSLLDAAKQEASSDPEEPESFLIEPEIDLCLRMVADRAAEAGVNLVNQLPEDLPAAFGRPRSLRQILLNLLVNAVKYTPAGGQAGISLGKSDDRSLLLEVWDTGVGIPRDEQSKIFEDTYRARDGRVMQSGSGFGLAISRDLARAMGGDITVVSKPKKGSRFTVRLPRGRESGG